MNLKLFFFWVWIFVLSLMGLVKAETLTGDITIANEGKLHTSQFIVNTIAEGKAWCDGYQTAVAQSIKNRDHFMKMSNQVPFTTHEETMKRIYASNWFTQHNDGNIVQQASSIERDAVDLYVVLEPTDLMISTKEGDVQCPAKHWK